MTADDKPRVGWVGTGVMGAPMCGHLLARGYPVTVHTRNKAKAQALVDGGATWASTPDAAGRQADVVFTIVGFPRDVREVYFGEHGLLAAARPGQTLVDMTTNEPTLAREISDAARARSAAALDAPVSGGDVGARNATLSIMVGGDGQAFERAQPVLRAMGRTGTHFGPGGSGHAAKATNQKTTTSQAISAVYLGNSKYIH